MEILTLEQKIGRAEALKHRRAEFLEAQKAGNHGLAKDALDSIKARVIAYPIEDWFLELAAWALTEKENSASKKSLEILKEKVCNYKERKASVDSLLLLVEMLNIDLKEFLDKYPILRWFVDTHQKTEALSKACRLAYDFLKNSGRRGDIQVVLREALFGVDVVDSGVHDHD